MMAGIPVIQPYDMPTRSHLLNNVADWKIEPNNAVLLIHDMQKYFLNVFPDHNPRNQLIQNTTLVRQYCQTAGIPVSYTQQPGNMTESERGLLKDFWGSGMKAKLKDKQIIEELTPNNTDWLFTKWRYSAFYQTDLLQRIQSSGRNQLIICGVYAHIGILATAIEAFSHNIKVFLVADAIADFSKTHHLMALNYASKCCAVVLSTAEVMS
jgi:isochorismate hydrolase